MKRIFIIGSINTDLVIKAPYMPRKGETLKGGDFFTAHGGKGANQAVAAARLGGDVIMCGCVGKDAFGKEAMNSLRENGIDVSHIRSVDGVSTGTAVITVVDGDNCIVLDEGANGALTTADIDRALENAKEGDIYLTQLENPIETIGYGLQKAKEKGMFVVLNPAPANVKIKPYLPYCDLITPNETEAELFGGIDEILKTTNAKLIVTLGDKGYQICDENGRTRYPCTRITAVDTTAAGDTFCGGLCVKLSKGERLEHAAAYGSKAATLACTRKGAQPSIPTAEELLRF